MRRAPKWRSAVHGGAHAGGGRDTSGGFDFLDDGLLVSLAAGDHERPAAMQDVIDAARAEIGRRGRDLRQRLIE